MGELYNKMARGLVRYKAAGEDPMAKEVTATRNVTVQLHIPRGQERAQVENDGSWAPVAGEDVLRAILRTHGVHNLAVAYYCWELRRWLKAGQMAGASDVDRAKAEFVGEIFAAQDVAKASRSKYKLLTDPRSKGEGATALADPTEEARLSTALDALLADRHAIERKAIRDAVAATGRLPGWIIESKESESGVAPKPEWGEREQKKLEEWIAGKRPGTTRPLARLVSAGVLGPQGKGHLRSIAVLLGMTKEAMRERGLSAEFGYGAFAQACTRLATDLSWRKRRHEERIEQEQRLAKEFGPHQSEPWWAILTSYEQDAATRYEFESGYAPKAGYHLGDGGELKGWGGIRRAWLKRRWKEGLPDPTAEDLRAIRIERQRRRPEEQGDHALFEWLALPAQWPLWDGRDAPDAADRAASLYDRVGLRRRFSRLSRRLKGIDWTWPDPLLHPLWVAYGDGGGSNQLPWSNLRCVGTDRQVELSLLWPCAPGGYEMRKVRLIVGENKRLAPSATGEPCLDERPVEVGGGKLLLERASLSRLALAIQARHPELRPRLGAFDVEHVEELVQACATAPGVRKGAGLRAWLSIALKAACSAAPEFLPLRIETVASNPPSAELGFLPRFIQPAAFEKQKLVEHGLRVLGVDLGVRHSAAVAVTQLVRPDAEGTKRKLPHVDETAVRFEKLLNLDLPGEGTSSRRLNEARWMLRLGRWSVGVENGIARMVRRLDAGIQSAREALAEILEGATIPSSGPREVPPGLRDRARGALAARERLGEAAAKARNSLDSKDVLVAWAASDELCQAIQEVTRELLANPDAMAAGRATVERRRLRKEGKAPPPLQRSRATDLFAGGLSIDRLEALEDWLRFERAFATRSRPGAPTKRRLAAGHSFMRTARERLLRMKKDRCRKIASLIIESALGGAPGQNGKKPSAPVHVIALEDLWRYKYAADRPRRENRRLISWTHREILKCVKLQADVHGLIVAAVPAAYSSRYSALTGAPGVRVDTVKEEWLTAEWWAREGESHRELLRARPGDRVVREGGPEFMAVDGKGGLMNADQNAAANIAFRFLCPVPIEPTYLRLEALDGGGFRAMTKGVWEGARFQALGDGRFEPEGPHRPKLGLKQSADEDESGMPEEFQAMDVVRVFRDPTGTIGGGAWVEADRFWGSVRQRVIGLLPALSSAAHVA